MDRAKDIIMKPMTFYVVLLVVLILGMVGMWFIGKVFPGAFGMTIEERARARRLAARMQTMMRNRRNGGY
jgi:hypothetical protein